MAAHMGITRWQSVIHGSQIAGLPSRRNHHCSTSSAVHGIGAAQYFPFPFTAGRQPTCFHDEDRLPGQLRRRGIAALDLGNRAQAFPHEARHIVEHALRAMG